jgi:tetratricopeptide (TPR) repeat protein
MGLFDDLFKKKGIPEKMNFLGKDYEINPDAMVYSQQGLDKYQQKDYAGSVTAFTKAINAQQTNQNFYTMRGTAYEDMGNDIDAEKDFRKTLELLPTDSVAAYRLGMVYFRKQDFENAVKWLKISHANSTGLGLEHVGITNNNIFFVHKKIIAGNLGNFLTQLKRYDEGYKYLDEAIKLDPNYANPYMTKGLALVQSGKQDEGMKYIKKASELGDPKAPAVLQMLNGLLGGSQKTNSSNPLNIDDDPQLNRMHKLPNLVAGFANDLMIYYRALDDQHGSVTIDQFISLTVYYSIDLLIEYRDKALNTLPSSIIEDVKRQVLEAAQTNFDVFNKQDIINKMFSQIDKKIWENNIVSETHNYMRQLQQ